MKLVLKGKVNRKALKVNSSLTEIYLLGNELVMKGKGNRRALVNTSLTKISLRGNGLVMKGQRQSERH